MPGPAPAKPRPTQVLAGWDAKSHVLVFGLSWCLATFFQGRPPRPRPQGPSSFRQLPTVLASPTPMLQRKPWAGTMLRSRALPEQQVLAVCREALEKQALERRFIAQPGKPRERLSRE